MQAAQWCPCSQAVYTALVKVLLLLSAQVMLLQLARVRILLVFQRLLEPARFPAKHRIQDNRGVQGLA